MVSSSKGKIMLALQSIIKGLQPEDISDPEVEVRESWLSPTGDPYRGVSIVDFGEQYDDGTISCTDVGYLCGVIFVKGRTADAVMPDDRLMGWYETTRRRLMDQRVPVYDYGITAPKEHVAIILPGKTLTNPDKWPNYLIRQLVVAVWIRENQTSF
jgi:hypothetical protein